MTSTFKVGDYVVFIGHLEKNGKLSSSKETNLISKIIEISHLTIYEKLRLNYGVIEFTDSSEFYRLATEKEIKEERLKSIFIKEIKEWEEPNGGL